MGFIEQQAGLAEQAAKANEYDKLIAARDAEYMANHYTNAGFQKGIETAMQQVPLYANDVRDNAAYNRLNYGADYSKQVPVQVPVTSQGLSGKAWTVDNTKAPTETELWLQRMREQKAKGN